MAYVVSAEVCNEGVKYADTFVSAINMCMFQCDPDHCSVRFSAEIKFIKNVNGLIKCEKKFYTTIFLKLLRFHFVALLEKGAYISIENGLVDLSKYFCFIKILTKITKEDYQMRVFYDRSIGYLSSV